MLFAFNAPAANVALYESVVSPVLPQFAVRDGYPLSSAFMLPVEVLHRVLFFALVPVQPVPT